MEKDVKNYMEDERERWWRWNHVKMAGRREKKIVKNDVNF